MGKLPCADLHGQKKDGLNFKQSTCYVIIGSDGLHPVFGRVDDITE